jgi:hypothetical protein
MFPVKTHFGSRENSLRNYRRRFLDRIILWIGPVLVTLLPVAAQPAPATPSETRWQRSARERSELAGSVTWLTHEPLEFLMRRGGHFGRFWRPSATRRAALQVRVRLDAVRTDPFGLGLMIKWRIGCPPNRIAPIKFPVTASEPSRWRGGRYAYVKDAAVGARG